MSLFTNWYLPLLTISTADNKSVLLTFSHINHINIQEYMEHFRMYTNLRNKCATNASQWYIHTHPQLLLKLGHCHDQCGLTQAHPNYSNMRNKLKNIHIKISSITQWHNKFYCAHREPALVLAIQRNESSIMGTDHLLRVIFRVASSSMRLSARQ